MDSFTIIKSVHQIVVLLFLIIYLIKIVQLLANKNAALEKFTKKVKVPEMIISVTFLATGVFLIAAKGNPNSFMIMKLVAIAFAIPLSIIGFKKANKLLATLGVFFIVMAYGLAEMSAKKVERVAVDPSLVVDEEAAAEDRLIFGKALYQANCVLCHGEDGKKALQGASDLTLSTMDDAAMMNIVKKGKGVMMPFSSALSDNEIDAVNSYVKSLRK